MDTKEEKIIKILQAFLDHKTIRFKSRDERKWRECNIDEDNMGWNFDDNEYEIKPTHTYRPYKPEELDQVLGRHIRYKSKDLCVIAINGYRKDEILVGINWFTFEETLEIFEYLDGSPCGKLEE